jgi:threonine dehydratase
VSVTLTDVEAARARVAPHVRQTPLERSPLLSRAAGVDLWLKQENRQHTGSFKPRGAVNKVLSLTADERRRGLVAASAGNHALGVAYACAVLGIEGAELYVQRTAAPAKIAKLGEYPVRLNLVGSTYEEAEDTALARAKETGAVFVSAYDDEAVIAGYGTCGLEILEELPDVDTVVVPVGGGALSAGIAVAVKAGRPKVRVVGVNAAASPSALLSFRKGEAIVRYEHEPTLAHGLAGGYGRIPFAVARELIDEIVLVTEEEMKKGIAALIDSDQVLAEASGIAAVAAVLYGKVRGLRGRVVAVVSGGNIDTGTLRTVLDGVES